MIEVIGLSNSIVISDQCLKTSNINLLGIEKVSSGRVTVKIVGDVGAITSAIQSVENMDSVISSSIIPSLDNEVFEMFEKDDNNIFKNKKIKNLNIELETNDNLENLKENNVSDVELEPLQSVSSLENIEEDTQNNNVKEDILQNQIKVEDENILQSNNDGLEQKNVKQLREILLKNAKLPYKEVKKMRKDELIKNIRNNLKGE